MRPRECSSSPPSSPSLDPRLLALKSAAYAALEDIFARDDAELREKRLAAAIVFRHADAVERRSKAGSPAVWEEHPPEPDDHPTQTNSTIRARTSAAPITSVPQISRAPAAPSLTSPQTHPLTPSPAPSTHPLTSSPLSPAANLLARTGAAPLSATAPPACVNFHPQVRPTPGPSPPHRE